MPRLNQLGGGLVLAVLAAYPLLVYWGLQHWSPRWIALGAGAALCLGFRRRFRAAPRVPGSWRVPLAVGLVLCVVTLGWNHEIGLRFMPATLSCGMLLMFAWTLWRPPSLVEQFALLLAGTLSEEERRYCRTVTAVWCGFFIVNISLSAATALVASRQVWALYNGLIAYVLMGALFAGEFIYRHWRFRRYVGLPTDPLFRRLFPPRSGPSPERKS
jgi:uncharacterized membrane protein